MEFFDNKKKYIIPFDSVDLSLLPSLNILPKFQENIMPLWNANNLQQRNEDCYYEFEIIQKEDTTDCDAYCSSTDGSPFMETDTQDFTLSRDMCYICNIEVPTTCMNEHLSSTKHKIFLKIAEISLERVRKQMGVNYKNENLPMGFSFCDTCTSLIPEGDMVSHTKLKLHKNAELIDKLLFDLSKIYSESEVADADDSANASKLETSKSSKDSRKVENVGDFKRKVVTGKVYDGSSKSNDVASKVITSADDFDVDTAKITSGGDNLDLDTGKITSGGDNLDLDTGKITSGGDNLDLDTGKITIGNGKKNGTSGGDNLDLDTGKITSGGDNLDLDTGKITSCGDNLDLDTGKITSGGDNLDLDTGKITIGNGKINVDSAKITTSNGKLDVCTAKVSDANGKSNKDQVIINAKHPVEVIYNKMRALKCMTEKTDFDNRIINNLDGDLNDYIRYLENKYYKVEVGDENGLVIETSGLRVKVTLANFHGLYVLGKGHMLCILCKKIERNIKKHIYSKRHLNNIKLPIDENCVRKLDDEKSHCIICNDTIEYPSFHALCNKEHDTKLKLSLVNGDTDKPEKSDLSSQKASDTEQIKIEDNPIGIKREETVKSESVATRLYSEATKETRKSSVDADIDAHVNLTTKDARKTSVDVDHIDASVDVSGSPEEICKVCYSSYNPADWEAHSLSPEHKSNEALLPQHLLEYSSMYRTLKCKVCLTGFPVHCKIQHISSPLHQGNYKKLLSVNNMVRTGRTVYCSTCVANMEIGDELAHLTSPKHKSLTINALASSELAKFNGQEQATIKPHYCKVCLVNVPGDRKNIKTHEDGARHKRNLALAQAKGKGEDIEKVQDKVSPVLPMKHRHEIRETAKPSQVECRVCSIILPNTVKNVSEHIEGSSHKNNVSLLERDSVKLYREIYWCGRCDIQVPIGEQFQHISTPLHTGKTSVEEGTSEEKNETKDTNSINSFYLNLLKPTENKDALSCQVCGVTVPNSGSTLRMHFDGVKHRSQLMKLLKSNCLSGMGLIGEFNCTICYYRFPSDNLLDHIERPRHVAGLGASVSPAAAKSQSDQNNLEADAKTKSGQKNQEADAKSKSGLKNQETDAKTKSGQKDQEVESKPKTNLESKLGQNDLEGVNAKPEQKPESVKVKQEDCPCVVCDVILTANEANIALHIDGARHKTNLKTLKGNRVRVLDGVCYCEACDIKFARDNLQQHVAGPHHLVMLG